MARVISSPKVVRRWVGFIVLLGTLTTGSVAAPDESDAARQQIDRLIDGLHEDAATARFEAYFSRFTEDAVFLGTDKTERWTIPAFKAYAKPVFADGRGWTYQVVSRNVAGSGATRWFDEVLHNRKLGHCRGTGVVVNTPRGWRIAHYSLSLLIPNSIAAEIGEQTQAIEGEPADS